MQSRTAALTVCLAVAFAAPAFAGARKKIDVPVMLGGTIDQDACARVGAIAGLNPRGDGFLSVRSGPGRNYAEMDRIYNGKEVLLCNTEGAWTTIVYDGEERDCGVGRPWPKRLAYTGPCKYGWVSSRYISVVAD
jgi:hypothetical protein